MPKRPRRSWLLVLTADDRKVEKAAATNADVMILDLSDSITPDMKARARERVVDWFTKGHPFGDKHLVIKPNNIRSEWGRDDLKAVCGLGAAGIYYPDPTSAEELQLVCDALDASGSDSEIMVLLEMAKAFVNLKDMCTVRRVTTLCHAQGDLSFNLGARLTDTRETLLYTASMTVVHARAYGLHSIDTILPSELRNQGLVTRYIQTSKDLGFDSCSTFYAPHIDLINTAFSPSDEKLAEAREIVVGYEKVRDEGRAAFVRDNGAWVTLHQYREAKALLEAFD
jgi:citrate lyase subunit beta/citryl-CoA lyase